MVNISHISCAPHAFDFNHNERKKVAQLSHLATPPVGRVTTLQYAESDAFARTEQKIVSLVLLFTEVTHIITTRTQPIPKPDGVQTRSMRQDSVGWQESQDLSRGEQRRLALKQ